MNLADKSENHTHEMPLLIKQWSIKRKLGVDSFYAPDSAKPKWMQWKTFYRKLEEIRSVDFELNALDLEKDFEYSKTVDLSWINN